MAWLPRRPVTDSFRIPRLVSILSSLPHLFYGPPNGTPISAGRGWLTPLSVANRWLSVLGAAANGLLMRAPG